MPRPTMATTIQHNPASPSFPSLPNPVLSFTIPSIHDGTTILECRIYHPHSLSPSRSAPPWRKHAAVIAHPYATLGGCYDDAVVDTISAALLRQGFVVGTFNFRGAGNSTGRTSWTGKPERGDYMSFAGFVYYYVHFLDPFRPPEPKRELSSPSGSAPTTASSQAEAPVLLLSGYSYGAMITTLLPPLHEMLEPFTAPTIASAAADIRLRAQHLAEKQNTILASARAESSTSARKAAFGGMRVGGDEDIRRSQEHGRRSFSLDAEEKIRKGVAELMLKAKMGHRKSREQVSAAVMEDTEQERETEPHALAPVEDLFAPRVAYLLVSPPVGWATHLMTMSLGGSFWKRPQSPKAKDPATIHSTPNPPEKQKLLDNPTLVIYGDSDLFVGVRRFREWTSKLQSAPRSHLRAHEISTAGHFFIEEGTMQRVADAVRAFAGELVVA